MAVENPIEEWQEHVISALESTMMLRMMPPREAHPSGQPSAQVHAPMDLLVENVVERETQEHSRPDSMTKKVLDRECRRCIQQKHKYHHLR